MVDKHKIRTEYLETLHQQAEATKLLLGGAAMIQIGGEDGIREIAQSNPEIILAAISGLAGVIQIQHEQHIKLAEDYFEILDSMEELADIIKPK